MKLWIDDLRPAPDGWMWAKSSAEALNILGDWLNDAHTSLEAVSFDHDLGGDDTTLPVLDWFVGHDRWPDEIFVHTANPVGRRAILATANRFAPSNVGITEIWIGADGTLPDM